MARAGGITNAVNVGIAVQADWENREFISNISLNVRRLFDFLVQFEATTKSKLASLNEKLDTLERRLELLEVQLSVSYGLLHVRTAPQAVKGALTWD
nr:protein BRICK 1 [Ipomoea batatas]